MNIYDLKPKAVWEIFKKITEIPHGSLNEKELAKTIYNHYKNKGLEVKKDEDFNLVIRKDASKGMENSSRVTLQGHLDMVCVKEENSSFDFTKDSLELEIKDNYLSAKDTSLGADNGIGVAMALALLEGDYIHPPLEVLLTTKEEIGLIGANNLDKSFITGKTLLNLDGEEEGVFITSSAGGVTLSISIPTRKEEVPEDFISFSLETKGLLGGHSGIDIDKKRGNALTILNTPLVRLFKIDGFLSSFSGGEAGNIIPTKAKAIVSIPEKEKTDALSILETYKKEIESLYKATDPELVFSYEEIPSPTYMYTEEATDAIIGFINYLPRNVILYSEDILGLVETSHNIGKITEKEEEFIITTSIRSQNKKGIEKTLAEIEGLAALALGEIEFSGIHSPWAYNPNSKVLEKAIDTYKDLYHVNPKVTAIHAGLECGILLDKNPQIDAISFGATLLDVHSTKERVEIDSVSRLWDFLLALLKTL